jgi:single-stranded DNA-specific DHH superfamily exonuclease
MKDMDKAVERVLRAIEKSEKILVYGDYDVDGTTSVALVYSYLKKYFKKRIEFYIPDRYEEGYGISYKGIDHAADNGFNLVIALDCGIKAVEKIRTPTKEMLILSFVITTVREMFCPMQWLFLMQNVLIVIIPLKS